MKKVFFTFIFAIFILSIELNAQSVWDEIPYPAGINSKVVQVIYTGNTIYIATQLDGVYSSAKPFTSWKQANLSGDNTNPIISMFQTLDGNLYVSRNNRIYRWNTTMKAWESNNYFFEIQSTLYCLVPTYKGSFLAGTNKGILESQGSLADWLDISENNPGLNVRKIACTPTNQIYMFSDSPYGGLFYTPSSGDLWVKTAGLDKTNPIAGFTSNANATYAYYDSLIFQYSTKDKKWINFRTANYSPISCLVSDLSGNLACGESKTLSIYNASEDTVYDNHPNLFFPSNIYSVSMNQSGFMAVACQKFLYVTDFTFNQLFTSMHTQPKLFKYIVFTDSKNNPIANRTLKLYKASCDNNQLFIQDVTTNADGILEINFGKAGLKVADLLKFERFIISSPTVKIGHEELNYKNFDIYLNNMKFDSVGTPSYYPLGVTDTQYVTLDHMQILQNLVISIEWETKREYMDSIKLWTGWLNDYLWDVTDGQLRLGKVIVYDGKQKWSSADIRFYASNSIFPASYSGGVALSEKYNAQVRMPRCIVSLGLIDNIAETDSPNWYQKPDKFHLNPNTMAYGLGKYLWGFYEEWVYSLPQNQTIIPKDYNFGFMDNYLLTNTYGSEMSNPSRYILDGYKLTAQYLMNGSDCWTQFEKKFEGDYQDSSYTIWCPITKPSERKLPLNMDYLTGPVDFQTGQFTCASRTNTDITVKKQNKGAGDFYAQYKITSGTQVSYPDSYLAEEKDGGYFIKTVQGRASVFGRANILGAMVGDRLIASRADHYIQQYYSRTYELLTISSNEKSGDKPLAEPNSCILNPINGYYNAVPSFAYDDAGRLQLKFMTNKEFGSSAKLSVQYAGGTKINTLMELDVPAKTYYTTLTDSLDLEGGFLFYGGDNDSKVFFIPVIYRNYFNGGATAISSYDGRVELFCNENKAVQTYFISSMDFLRDTTGFDISDECIGAMYSIASNPHVAQLPGINVLTFRYDVDELFIKTPNTLKIFRWDESGRKWALLNSIVDTAAKTVSVRVSSLGTYALFATEKTVGLLDYSYEDIFNLEVKPNPASDNSEIRFELPAPANVRLSLYDELGNQRTKIFTGTLAQGRYALPVDATNIENGVYFVRMEAGGRIFTKKFIVVR